MKSPHLQLLDPPIAGGLLGTALAALLGLALADSAVAAEVSFQQAFAAATHQDVMVVTVANEDVLVLEPGAYHTHGKRLFIVAARARLSGETKIGFFPLDARPPTKQGVASTGPTGPAGAHRNCGGRSGCDGTIGNVGVTGASGDDGANASSMIVDIRELQGDGKLILLATGQGGGKGQQGGKGGTGGRGGDGAEISCGGLFGLDTRAGPGNGGTGGPGGPGGKGGTGGNGGAGGMISLATELADATRTGLLVVDLSSASGGGGGDPGEAGDPGDGGSMGGGGSCGDGGRSGSGGGPGSVGQVGETGPSGVPGSLRFWTDEVAVADSLKHTHRQKVAYSLPISTNCQPVATAQVEVQLPKDTRLVQVNPLQVTKMHGASGHYGATVRLGANPDNILVSANFRRIENKYPDLELVGLMPRVIWRSACPSLSSEMEVHYVVTPVTTTLGKKLEPK